MRATALKQTQLASPLASQAVIRPKGNGGRRLLVSSLMLTSLVDAFSILVIFLLMNAKSGIEELELKKTQHLPKASAMDIIARGIILRIEENGFFVNDEPVNQAGLAQKLEEAKIKFEAQATQGQKAGLIVEADRKMDYEAISPILQAGALAGIHQFKFAVVEKEN